MKRPALQLSKQANLYFLAFVSFERLGADFFAMKTLHIQSI